MDAKPCWWIIVIDPEIVAAKLKNLKSDKAAGDDNLSSRLLRNISSEIASPIAIIFRKSLDTGCIPHDWRTANVTPLVSGRKLTSC